MNEKILEYDTDFESGVVLEGKVCRVIMTVRYLIEYLIVEFPDGRRTRVPRHSFLVSKSMPELYHIGDSIKLIKVGFMVDRHLNKWQIKDARRDIESNQDAIKYFMQKRGNPILAYKKHNKYHLMVLEMQRPFAEALKGFAPKILNN